MTATECAVADCFRVHSAKGYCTQHYQKFRKYGDPLAVADSRKIKAAPGEATCTNEGCEYPVKARALCKTHYEQFLASVPQSERSPGLAAQKALQAMSKEDVTRCLVEAKGSMTLTAKLLGVKRQQIRTYAANNSWFAELADQLWAEDHTPELLKERQDQARKVWRENNPDTVREINRRWARNQDPANRAKWNHHNRLARGSKNDITEESVEYMKILAGDPCVYCGSKSRITIDHIVPLKFGGTNDWENFAPVCWSCNSSKGTRSVLTHLSKKFCRYSL